MYRIHLTSPRVPVFIPDLYFDLIFTSRGSESLHMDSSLDLSWKLQVVATFCKTCIHITIHQNEN